MMATTDYKKIQKIIEGAIEKFNKRGPDIDKAIYKTLIEELKRLDVREGRIKTTVANLRIINSIKNKLQGIILSDDYLADVKDYVKSFNELTKLQNQYWKGIDNKFNPGPYFKEIRTQAITDTVKLLGETGVAGDAIGKIGTLLTQNITGGGSYSELAENLHENIVVGEGFSRTARQVTVDAVNQYSAQYTQAVSNDLGLFWYAYRNTTIKTTRPFCYGMTERRYFHVTEIPFLMKAELMTGGKLTYINPKSGQRENVPLNPKTNLPDGFIKGTNASNFLINRGGYNCGHQCQPVPERNVPKTYRDEVEATPTFKRWKAAQ